MLLNLFTIIGALILQRVLSEETIDARQDLFQLQTTISFNLGSPSVPQKLRVYLGTKSYSQLGQFIIDQSYTENNQIYADQIKYYKITLYDMKKSTTAQIQETFEKEDQVYDQKIQGVFVNDMLSYNKIQSKYKFACATYGQSQYFYYNGVIIFNRLDENIFDQMYQSKSIRTSDYILSGSKSQILIDNFPFIQNNIHITFDLDKTNEYYNNPSNPLVSNSDTFQIMSYGIYLNHEDVTDKLKNKKVTLDQITNHSSDIDETIYLPNDLFQIMQNQYNLPDSSYFQGCAQCQCQEAANLPEITLITEQYKIIIKPSQYIKSDQYDCLIYLSAADSFVISSSLLLHTESKIMYQKQSNSIKIINGQLINHLNIDCIMAIFSTFTGIITASLSYIILIQLLNLKLYKQEEEKQRQQLTIIKLKNMI
ncbi:eukaryotic aspartyl protease family protein (macronuclear) [Tetrahymena thermophila SB210]|uniref:Eukaryotic aspartyl protease family protein n=1 Tax=Tetrahymena thermophila (strain SB210) TaxID=312017 RepID=Q23RP9_TETTS|nr:eukaryotic aspartyl protease family protein [Tetrahymena thermophila SB210]EAR99188.1 eukaryotic aspartyl protease family protein [Tetrahymena thermophila SB210]|eukprot:XP_001019433.1 eukaryotic aspartyl protease family protein [Tetrahymena thermophila SB210]